jgi:hypothetical protein
MRLCICSFSGIINKKQRKYRLSISKQPYYILLYINYLLLLLLTLTLVAKSFSSSYKELPSATSNNSRGINERREQQQTPSPRFCRCFRLCVSLSQTTTTSDWDRQRLITRFYPLLSSLLLMVGILIVNKRNKNLLLNYL